MINPERGKLIPVTGNADDPDLANAVDVQFNPSSLKVSLSNTLKESQRNGNTRAAQYVDKSSSSLSIELIFDTTLGDTDIEEGSDVRLLTKRIAEKFIKPVASGNRLRAPKRCLFQWGAFEFLGLVESFEETLDFFSPEGRPLHATVALSLKEDRYQFRNRDVDQAERETPTLTSTGNAESNNPDGNGADRPNQNSSPVPGGSDNKPGNWRNTALFNGVENPRLPSASVLAVPKLSASASIGLSASISAGVKTSVSAGVGASASVGTQSSGPAFSFGSSGSLGTGIAGAFNVSGESSAGLAAGSLISGGTQLRSESKAGVSSQIDTSVNAKIKAGVGFD